MDHIIILHLVCYNAFSSIWPGDLLFDPMRPTFKHGQEFIMRNIMTKSQYNLTNHYQDMVRDNTFYRIWPSALVFDPMWPTFEIARDIIKGSNLTKFELSIINPSQNMVPDRRADGRATPKQYLTLEKLVSAEDNKAE